MTIERSHGAPRLTQPRLSDLETVDTGAERQRDRNAKGQFTPGNAAATASSAKRTLTRGLRAAVQDDSGGAIAPSEAREVAQDALALYGAARRTVGNGSPLVLARLVRNAVNDVLADRLTAEAVRVGIATELGGQLLERAHKCEARAERAMVAALTAAKVLGTRPPKGTSTAPPWFETEGEETDE